MSDAAPGRRPRLGLLVCGHVAPAAQDLGGDYPELFAALLEPHGVEVVPHDVVADGPPVDPASCDGWLTSPSRASVLDDDPWIAAVATFVRQLVTDQRPFAGICFGHQLLAHALGGRVERATVGWGVGAHRYEVVAAQPWMRPPAPAVTLIASHEDQVQALPPGATLLARTDHCPIAMFALGERAIGLQPHPEFTADISRRLTELRRDLIGPARADAALTSLATPLDRDVMASWLVHFLVGR